jgi:hypothetical protein
MRKIVFLSLVIGFVYGNNAAFSATYDCSIVTIDFGINQDYSLTLDGIMHGFKCKHDETNGCADGTQIVISGQHRLGRKSYNNISGYVCSKTGNNKWDRLNVNEIPRCQQNNDWPQIGTLDGNCIFCAEPQKQHSKSTATYCLHSSNMCRTAGACDSSPVPPEEPDNNDCPEGYEHPTADDAEIEISSPCENCSKLSVKECYSKKMLMCYRAMKTNPKTVWWNNYDTCFCKNNKGLVGIWQDGRCVVNNQDAGFCAQLEKQGATTERLKCCYAGSNTKWVDANGVEVKNSLGKTGEKCICKDTTKTWNSAKGICEGQNVIGGNCDKYLGDVDAYKCCSGQSNGVSYWDEVNKKCHCLKTGEEWDYNQHMCLKKNSTGDEKECRYRFHGEFKCANGTRIRRDYEFILSKEDLKNMTCEKFQERYRNDARGIESLFQKLCLDSQNTEQIPLDAATKRAISNINSFFDMSESNRNVWRDEEGQFNTARLASDATAGVVLGTVGGIVSAKVIKKKQLEKGFDVLHCTVGGQKMADYGDTFQVSYQR